MARVLLMELLLKKQKRGKEGKPRVTYSGSYAINDEAYRTKMLSAYEMAQYINIMTGPFGDNQTTNPQQYFFSPDELEAYKTINHDWLNQAWKASSNMRHSLNVSGGAERATYFANVSYYTQDGNLGRLDFSKWTFRAGADVNLLTGLKTGLQISGNYQDLSRVNSEIGGENAENDYRNLLRAPRYVPTYINGLMNYAYDLSAYTLLSAWRGKYIDVSNMWTERGETQRPIPLGTPIEFMNKPNFAKLSDPADGWPDTVSVDNNQMRSLLHQKLEAVQFIFLQENI